ncbi:MAG: hypothetical protein QOF51_2836 [Chloroflexota bacterium]|jgi:hypothetical protein|nr:hypothetical protein [Chloroflexota bacterium]
MRAEGKAMDNFARTFQEKMLAARAAHERETAEREEESSDRQTRASQLERHVELRFAEAGGIDSSAVRYAARADGDGASVHELTWVAPLPARTLLARIDQVTRNFWWAWAYGGNTSGWSEADSLSVHRRDVDVLVEQLADQDRWERGERPASALDLRQGAA